MQTELSGMLTQECAALIDRVTSSDVPKGHEWPKVLSDFIAVVQAELTRRKLPDSGKHAVAVVVAIAEYIGGREIYIPANESLHAALTHLDIYTEWSKNGDVQALSERYQLTARRIYQVLTEQRALHKSTQERLFA